MEWLIWVLMNRKQRGSMEMSTEDARRTHRRHIDCMEQHEKPEEMNSSPWHWCICVLQCFELVAIWLEDENMGGIT